MALGTGKPPKDEEKAAPAAKAAKPAAPKKAAPKPKKAAAAQPEPASAAKAAKAEKAAAPRPAPEKGFKRVYPTHRRQAGPLLVSLPSDGYNSPDTLEVTDEGTDVPDEIAQQLIQFGEATTTAPKAEKDAE